MSSKNNQIVLSTKIQKAVEPAPKKSEIVEALAIKKLRQFEADLEQARTELESAKKLLATARARLIQDWLKTNTPEFAFCNDWSPGELMFRSEARVKVPASHEVMTLRAQAEKAKQRFEAASQIPSFNAIKQQVRFALDDATGGNRVQALLEDKEASKALDRLLSQLDKQAEEKRNPSIALDAIA